MSVATVVSSRSRSGSSSPGTQFRSLTPLEHLSCPSPSVHDRSPSPFPMGFGPQTFVSHDTPSLSRLPISNTRSASPTSFYSSSGHARPRSISPLEYLSSPSPTGSRSTPSDAGSAEYSRSRSRTPSDDNSENSGSFSDSSDESASTRSRSPTPFFETQGFRAFQFQFPASPRQSFTSCRGCHGDESGNCSCLPLDDDSDEEDDS